MGIGILRRYQYTGDFFGHSDALLIETELHGSWVVFEDAGRLYVRRILLESLGDVDPSDFIVIRNQREMTPLIRSYWNQFVDLAKKGSIHAGVMVGERGEYVTTVVLPKRKTDVSMTWDGPTSAIRSAMMRPMFIERWSLVEGKTPHSVDDFRSVLNDALVDVWRAWGWAPRALVIRFTINKNGVYGSATKPESSDGSQIIGLSPKLMGYYTLHSIKRTILHELAHHKVYDEEFDGDASIPPHGDRFCELLGMVDPLVVGNKRECVHFTDDIDYGSIRRRMPEDPSKIIAVISPHKRIKSNQMIAFSSNERKPAFKPWKIELSYTTRNAIISVFGKEASRIALRVDPTSPAWIASAINLQDLLDRQLERVVGKKS